MTAIPIYSRSYSTGFTAIEVVIVVMVLGTLAALAAPLLNSALVDARLGSATADISAAIEFAQMAAMNTGRPCRVSVDADTETLRVEQRVDAEAALLLDPAETEIDAGVVELEESYLEMENPNHPGSAYTVDLRATGVEVAKSGMGPAQPLLFSEVGKPSSAAEVILTCAGRERRIDVDGLSGAVTYSE
ncbi:MAG: prepilin-type N-terminal cleavage/methylation domain-containing protein [Candidatus Hydrogenedentes bacterium]|nr:prepilin-type N-terminal cleavage/methylation domain-containing protein [Candidatus Hydrogenedentota bacterium]